MDKGLWSRTKLYCMHGHEIPMVIQEGFTPFYACPHYFLKDDTHPDGHLPNEKMCVNRISLMDAESVMMSFLDAVEEDRKDDAIVDYRNYTFRHKQIDVKVLKYTPKEIIVGIRNNAAIRK